MWQPDGVGSLARIGLLVPDFDLCRKRSSRPWRRKGSRSTRHDCSLGTLDLEGNTASQRGPAAARTFAEPPQVDHAALLLASIPVDVIVYAYTASSYICGSDGDAALKARLEARARGIRVVIPTEAFRLALHAVGARRIALIHPPWFSADLDKAGAAYFRSHGFDVAYHAPAPFRSDFGESLSRADLRLGSRQCTGVGGCAGYRRQWHACYRCDRGAGTDFGSTSLICQSSRILACASPC